MTAYALGIDLGTSGVKVAVLDLSTFKLIALAMQGYDNSPHQPSTMLWEATAATIREAAAGIDVRAIRGISLSGQMHGTVLYDAQGEVIDPIINWQDKRCDIPLAKYDNRSTVETMMERLAGPEFDDLGIDILASGYLGATLFHIKENEPALFDRIHHVVLPGDFIRAKLLGACDCATDPTNACSTGLFNTRLGCWHEEVIRKLGLPRDILPVVHDTAEIAGVLPAEVARVPGPGAGHARDLRRRRQPDVAVGQRPDLRRLSGPDQYRHRRAILTGGPAVCQDSRHRYAQPFQRPYALVGASMGGGRNYAQLRDDAPAPRGRGRRLSTDG